MLKSIHEEITRQAVGHFFHPAAMENILKANIGQDGLVGLLRAEYHFDSNAFEEGAAYVETQRKMTIDALDDSRRADAWAAFGRLVHTVQDFYAHSNYVALWLAAHGDSPARAPEEIDPVDPRLLASPSLRSGKIYYPHEILYFLPGLRKLALSILPADSHAHMNLDSAERGPHFPYAFAAAVKRTRIELEELMSRLSPAAQELFSGEIGKLRPGIDNLRFTFSASRSMP